MPFKGGSLKITLAPKWFPAGPARACERGKAPGGLHGSAGRGGTPRIRVESRGPQRDSRAIHGVWTAPAAAVPGHHAVALAVQKNMRLFDEG